MHPHLASPATSGADTLGRSTGPNSPARLLAQLDALLQADEALLTSHGWRVRKRSDRVTVNERSERGFPYHQFLVDGVIAAPISVVRRLLVEDLLARYHEWNPLHLDGRILGALREDADVVWQLNDRPAPGIGKRDTLYLRAWRERADGGTHLLYRSVDERLYPVASDVVRCDLRQASHVLTPAPGGATRFRYVMQNDPRGRLPAFLVNRVTAEVLYKHFVAIRQLTEGAR